VRIEVIKDAFASFSLSNPKPLSTCDPSHVGKAILLVLPRVATSLVQRIWLSPYWEMFIWKEP